MLQSLLLHRITPPPLTNEPTNHLHRNLTSRTHNFTAHHHQQTLSNILPTAHYHTTNTTPTTLLNLPHTHPTQHLGPLLSTHHMPVPQQWTPVCSGHTRQMHTPSTPCTMTTRTSLPLSTTRQLTTIGWTRCCMECPHIFLIPTDLTLHQESCPIYTSKPPTQPTNQAPSQPTTNHSNNPHWALVFQICPPNRHNDLNEVITNSSTSKQPLTGITQNILELVTNWFLTTVPTQPMANSATTHITND